MDGDAIEKILDAAGEPMALGGFLYRPNSWSVEDATALIKPGPTAKTLGVSTLGAVRDYLAANHDALVLADLVVHVVSPMRVSVLGPLDTRSRVREEYLQAIVTNLTTEFVGLYMPIEQFLIGLQTRFCDTSAYLSPEVLARAGDRVVDDRAIVLRLLSGVKSSSVKTALDDGMTQIVEARAGVALVSDVAVPNPVTLTGFRTFRDVVQPSSIYVLRVRDGKAGGLPEVALFEADGGAWQLQAIARVRDWLREALPADVAVLA